MPSLYNYTQQYRAVADLLWEEEVETETVYDTLDAIDEPLKEKAETIGNMIREYQADAKALKEEAKRLKERAEAKEKKADSLLRYVETAMAGAGFDKLEGLKNTFSFSTNTSLKCVDVKKLPKHFQKPQEPKPDIAGFKADIVKRYDDKGIKLVSKYSAKPKGKEMLFTELNEDLTGLGIQFETNRKVSLKTK